MMPPDLLDVDQKVLRDLYQSKARGSASLQISGPGRVEAARRLAELGFVEWHGFSYGTNFYHITPAGKDAYDAISG